MSVVDTNVLVHSTASNSPDHGRARSALARLIAQDRVAVTRQILREYIAVMTRQQPWSHPLSLNDATNDTHRFLRRFVVLEDGPPAWDQLMILAREFSFGGRQVHDANIVATMLAHGETRLLTFNGSDFRRFGTVIDIVTP